MNMGKAEKASSSHNAYHPHPYASSSTVPQSRASRVPSHALPSHERPSVAWSAEDDERLIACRKENMNWGPIATQYFPTKTPNACRKRHERLMEKKKQEGWDGVKLEELATVYLECHEEMWQLLATKVKEKLDMNEKWQTLESKCMEKGLKTLTSVGRSVSRRSNRGPSTSPMSHSSDQDKFRDSGLGPDHSRDSVLEHPYTGTHSRASSGPTYPSPSNPQAYSSSCSSAALPSASLATPAPYPFNPAPVMTPDPRHPSHTLPALPSFDAFSSFRSLDGPYRNTAYCS